MGRGSSGLASGSGGSKQSDDLYKGLRLEGVASNQTRADDIVKSVRDVLSDFGLDDELTGVTFSDSTTSKDTGMASMNGFGQLTIINKHLNEPTKNSNGYFVSDSDKGTGTHEAGHAVVNALLKRVDINPDETNKSDSRKRLERATARTSGKLENAIMREAKKRYGSNPKISGYGSKNVIEKVAEAVSDVYTNKQKANPYSKVIVGVMKDIKDGAFKPKITVTKKQMGI